MASRLIPSRPIPSRVKTLTILIIPSACLFTLSGIHKFTHGFVELKEQRIWQRQLAYQLTQASQ